MNYVIFGAGAIGCGLSVLWSRDQNSIGSQFTLLGRKETVLPLRSDGLTLTQNGNHFASTSDIAVSTESSDLADADVIVLAMKSTGLDQAIKDIQSYARADAVIVSLLNGLAPVRTLRQKFPDRTVLAGMVPFNVVWKGPTTLNISGAGDVALERHPTTHHLKMRTQLYDDLSAIQHGKLLLNLANAVNALAAKPLYDVLTDRNYRRVYAASLKEALMVYDIANTKWDQIGPNNPRLAKHVLNAPNWLFKRLVLSRQNIDQSAMTSMASDLIAQRPTEIDTINGEIARLGKKHNIDTPVNNMLISLVKDAEHDPAWAGIDAIELLRKIK